MKTRLVVLSLLSFGLSGCDNLARQNPPLPQTGDAHRQAYFDAIDRVPGQTGEDLPYHERATIWNENRR